MTTTIECRTGQRTGLLDLAAELYRAEYRRHRTPAAWARSEEIERVKVIAWPADVQAEFSVVREVWVHRDGRPVYRWDGGESEAWPRGWAWVPWTLSGSMSGSPVRSGPDTAG